MDAQKRRREEQDEEEEENKEKKTHGYAPYGNSQMIP